jgi:acetolactate synthase-1/2/3 large subunit
MTMTHNGAQSLIQTLVDAGVEVCFANPGTSEMHFVAALDSVPRMRGVLALFEGVATGAADGYARIAGKPAVTLLHLGPGLGNGLANLHNAKRAFSPVVNVVGDHAIYHKKYDAPLESDIDSVAQSVSIWTHRSTDVATVGADAAAAVAAASGGAGGVASLILPADVSWSDGGTVAAPATPVALTPVPQETIEAVAKALTTGEPTVILLGGRANSEEALKAASRIAVATGASVLGETFPAVIPRGVGVPNFDKLGYLAEMATWQLSTAKHVILAGVKAPTSFFAYPGKPSELVGSESAVHTLAASGFDVEGALLALAEIVAAGVEPVLSELSPPALPEGELTAQTLVETIGAVLPENSILVDESNTSGLLLPASTAHSPRHDLLTLTGGAIGQGLPVATGAAIAAPDRPVLCLEADGSAMYTIQSLWTQKRENSNVTTVIINNGAYAILRLELQRVGADGSGPKAAELLNLRQPDLDFVAIATGMGVPATRATTVAELADQLRAAFAADGPHVIEAVVPPLV